MRLYMKNVKMLNLKKPEVVWSSCLNTRSSEACILGCLTKDVESDGLKVQVYVHRKLCKSKTWV